MGRPLAPVNAQQRPHPTRGRLPAPPRYPHSRQAVRWAQAGLPLTRVASPCSCQPWAARCTAGLDGTGQPLGAKVLTWASGALGGPCPTWTRTHSRTHVSVQSRSPPRTRGPPIARGVQWAGGIIPQTPLAVGPTGRPGTQQRRRLGDNAPQSDGCHKALSPVGSGSRVQAGEALPASVTHCCSPPIPTPRQFTVPRKPGRSPTASSRTGSHPGQHAKGSEKSCRTLSEDVRAGILHLTSPHTRLPNLTHWRGSWAGAGGGKITGEPETWNSWEAGLGKASQARTAGRGAAGPVGPGLAGAERPQLRAQRRPRCGPWGLPLSLGGAGPLGQQGQIIRMQKLTNVANTCTQTTGLSHIRGGRGPAVLPGVHQLPGPPQTPRAVRRPGRSPVPAPVCQGPPAPASGEGDGAGGGSRMMSLCKWHSGLGWSNRGLFGRRKTGVIEAQTADAPENKARRRVPTRR